MHIFIDESGIFTHPQKKKHLISCVTGLVVPDGELSKLGNELLYFKRKWGFIGEIKGNKINEAQAKNLVKRLQQLNLFAYSVCIDMGLHTPGGIESHKISQANAFSEAATTMIHATARDELHALANEIEATSNQLYVQSTLLIQLCDQIIRKSTLYYSQKAPHELGSFKWNLDAKGSSFETLWKKIVAPGIQSKFLAEHHMTVKEFDYSYFDKSFKFHMAEIPKHLIGHVAQGASNEVIDIKKLITNNLEFCDSQKVPGLQVVDMLSSIITRACNDTLQKEGWENIGNLFLHAEKGSHALGNVALENFSINASQLPYNDFFKNLYSKARPIFVK
jgi:hypothetical protein